MTAGSELAEEKEISDFFLKEFQKLFISCMYLFRNFSDLAQINTKTV